MASPIIQQITDELEALHKELSQFKSTVEYLNSAKSIIESAKTSVDSAKDLLSSKADELNFTYETMLNFTERVDSVVKKVDTINFPDRLDKIEQGFSNATEILSKLKIELTNSAGAVLDQIKSIDFDQKFLDLQHEVGKTVTSNKEIIQSVKDQKIPEKIGSFEKNVSNSIKESGANLADITQTAIQSTSDFIAALNIPLRMDKLDANIAGILAAIQNVQSRLETAERSIIDKIKDANEKNLSSIASYEEKAFKLMDELKESNEKLFRSQRNRSYITWGLILITLGAISVFYYLTR